MITSLILNYCHIPDYIQQLVLSLCSNFHTSILTNTFQTPFMTVDQGVLQGNCLIPLTLILCFIVISLSASSNNWFHNQFSLCPIYWAQFGDDAAVIAGLENENQILLNNFTRWCALADTIVGKCSTFGIKNSSTSSTPLPS